jgi:hypothetical protein
VGLAGFMDFLRLPLARGASGQKPTKLTKPTISPKKSSAVNTTIKGGELARNEAPRKRCWIKMAPAVLPTPRDPDTEGRSPCRKEVERIVANIMPSPLLSLHCLCPSTDAVIGNVARSAQGANGQTTNSNAPLSRSFRVLKGSPGVPL